MTIVRTGAVAGAARVAIAAGSPAHAEMFNRIATFNVVDNLPADADPETATVSEIVAATALCGEISLGSAVVADEWVSSHEKMGRNR